MVGDCVRFVCTSCEKSYKLTSQPCSNILTLKVSLSHGKHSKFMYHPAKYLVKEPFIAIFKI